MKNLLVTKNLELLLALLAGKTDDEILVELRIPSRRTLELRKKKLAKSLLDQKEKKAKCSLLPPGGWSQVPSPPILSHVSTRKQDNTCKVCKKPIEPVAIPDCSEPGTCAGELTELADHGVCSMDCFATLCTPPGEIKSGKGRRINNRGPWEPSE